MDWQKLNDTETYVNLWNKFKGLFHKKKKDDKSEAEDTDSEDVVDTKDSEQTGDDADAVNENAKEKKQKDKETGSSSDVSANGVKQIDFVLIFKAIAKHKWLYIIIIPVVFVLSCLYILNEPRTYSSSTTMAPEVADASSLKNGSLSSIAESFGLDLSNTQSIDAISPLLYPELMNDNGFVTGLFNIKIQTSASDSVWTYYDYLMYHQKKSWASKKIKSIKDFFTNLVPKSDDNNGASRPSAGSGGFDAYDLSKTDDQIADAVRSSVSISVDKKTGIISITTVSQDPLASKIIADSVRSRLQNFITNYRTSKSRRDVEYYEKLAKAARTDYEKTRRKYAATADENLDVVLESEKSKIEDLENTMQLQYNRYTALNSQLDAARAKLLQYTPAFTVITGAAVPIKPTGPKRMIFVLVMVIIATVVITLYVAIKERKSILS